MASKPMGRPTKYTDTMQAHADAYVDGGFVECNDVVPSRAGLALELGVSRTTLANWEQDHPNFLVTLERLNWVQERLSLNGGLRGDLNSTIVKLLLANHGYSDRQAIDHTTAGESLNKGKSLDDFYADDVQAKPES